MSDIIGHNEPLVKIVCNECKHRKPKGICTAFKKGIPSVIFSGKNQHSKPLPNQGNDIVFEPKKK
jgi:hypothetical protein